jgi:hypothetical protein
MFEKDFVPLITPTITQIVSQETGFYYSRKIETKHFTFRRNTDPEGTKRIYSWDPKISTGTPVKIHLYGTRTMYFWMDNEEISFNPIVKTTKQNEIQSIIDKIHDWNCQSAEELKNLIEQFYAISEGRIFSTHNQFYDFMSAPQFLVDMSIPTEHYSTYLNIKKEHGKESHNIDIEGNDLVADNNGNLVIKKLNVPKISHLSPIELFLYRAAASIISSYYEIESRPIKITADGNVAIPFSQGTCYKGITISYKILVTCFGEEKVKNKETILQLSSISCESLPFDKWPNRPIPERTRDQKKIKAYKEALLKWAKEGCKANEQKEIENLYELLLEIYHEKKPDIINYPEGSYKNIGSSYSFGFVPLESAIPKTTECIIDESPIINNPINKQNEQTASKSKITTLEMFSTLVES